MMDENAAYEWLTWLYGDSFEGRIWIGGHADGFRGATFSAIESAVTYAAHLDAQQGWGVYHRLTTVGQVERRGLATDSVMLPALMADIDVHGPGHKAENLPRDFADVQRILTAAGTPDPSTWVNSGGGLYPAWKLAEPMLLTDEPTLKYAQEASRRLHRNLITAAKSLGMKVDNTSDLARVYRLPGTVNRKVEGEHRHAKWINAGVTLDGYSIEDVAEGWPKVAEPPSSLFSGVAEEETEPQSSLFAPVGQTAGAHGAERRFTAQEAMAFVLPFLDALAQAPDGEINVRLNAAACALAHFGPEFWDEAAADRQLDEALACTMYDGLTWKAEDTIASARRAMAGDWRAAYVPATPQTVEEVQALAAAAGDPDPVDVMLAELLDFDQVSEIPPPRYLIHGLLQFDSESWIIGAPGSKKSFVALDMAARVARGEREWQGRRINPADVVMIVAEGAGGMGKRAKAWRKRFGEVNGLKVLPRPVQSTAKVNGERVISPEWRVLIEACGRLADAAAGRDRGMLVVIDTQARVTVGHNENAAEDAGQYVEAVRRMKERTRACVLTIHHTGRAGADARGSNAIDGAQTTELKVDSKPKTLTGKLIVEKQKDIEEIESVQLGFEVIDLGQDLDGDPVNSLVLAEPGSVAFKAAWSDAEAGQQSEAPIRDRNTVEQWIRDRTDPRAEIQRWIVQVLVDTAETLGLTQSDVRGIVAEKLDRKVETSTFKRAWQTITEDGGPWEGIVVRAGGERWTVDKLRIAELSGVDA